MNKVLWLSDLHLDETTTKRRHQFYHRLSKAPGEVVVITGDISNARHLCSHLVELGEAAGKRPVYFVLGNHDYYGSSFSRVNAELASLCSTHKNLRRLGQGEIIPLSDHEALVGHDGWADGRAGHGFSSRVRNPDFWNINDFRNKDWKSCYSLMGSRGMMSANYFRRVLPYALTCYRHLWLATHVPPFTQAAWWNGKLCNYDFQPHYCNSALGQALWGMSMAFASSTMTVLSGHTHSEASVLVRGNLSIRAAGATPGYPRYHLPTVD